MTKMDEDMAFLEFRAECLKEARKTIEDLITNWMKDYDLTDYDIAYSHDLYNRTLILYTDRPGYLIGFQGKQIEDLRSRLFKTYNHSYEARIIEIKNGGFIIHKERTFKNGIRAILSRIFRNKCTFWRNFFTCRTKNAKKEERD